jgi:1,4-alpha-glucan branching enzyme
MANSAQPPVTPASVPAVHVNLPPPAQPDWRSANDGTRLIADEPTLHDFAPALRWRYSRYRQALERLAPLGGLTGEVSTAHHYYGFHRGVLHGKPGVFYREWAPGAHQLRLIGDFNDWNRLDTPMTRDQWGNWHVFLPDETHGHRLTHGSRVKVHVVSDRGAEDRIPAFIQRVVQEPGQVDFTAIFWMPLQPYAWKHPSPKIAPPSGQRIYEAHIGMAGEEGRVHSYSDFQHNVLPRIKALGYNTVQLMAIAEHPYYGSFGYHVSNFFAASSRFGTPEDLKELIDAAHGMGMYVLMDLVHSHSVKNTVEGLNGFDGTDYQYFHAGARGQHVLWDSLCFDYSKFEVQRFLLSNVRYWLEEFRFDGFRFDGVTSMIYRDHGMGRDFGPYPHYFDGNVDEDAVTYLQLAATLCRTIAPHSVTIAEEVSGMPGLARLPEDGGIGFDFRLAMGVPDYWIKLLKEKSDEDWDPANIYFTLIHRRFSEKHVGYAESHDQALVGDKTLIFWLADKDMYWHMSHLSESSLVVDRALALHKIIRMLSFSLATGGGYLNFIGNEFGHPEWVDFPRAGNNNSYHYARRQWSLADNSDLKYKGLNDFDKEMLKLDSKFGLISDPFIEKLWDHKEEKQLVYRRGPLVFVANFHPTKPHVGWRIPVPENVDYRTVLSTDEKRFSGPGLLQGNEQFHIQGFECAGRSQSVEIYLPPRTMIVLAPVR